MLPHERPRRRRRARVRHELSRLHRLAVTRRRASVGLAAVVVLLVAFAFGSGRGAPDTVPLGRGTASVEGQEPYDEVAEAPDARPAPEAEPETPVEPRTVRRVRGGVASYYGEELAGRPTASGERFNPERLTAAHRTLPLGSRLRVTNTRNGRSVVVRVNDRGPFHGGRVLDLSKAAARRIGLLQRGQGQVSMELIE